MRITYIYSSLTTVGGTDRVIIEKANCFAEQCDYEIYMITDSQLGLPTVFPLSTEVKHIDLKMNFFKQKNHSFFVRGYICLKLMHIYKSKLKKLEKSLLINTSVKNIVDKYLESYFHVMSSRFEGFGMILIAAITCGIPCISFSCPNGPADIIKDREDGILVENGKVELLAAKNKFLYRTRRRA